MSTTAAVEASSLLLRVEMQQHLEARPAYWRRRAEDYSWVITGDRQVAPTEEQLESRVGLANLIWFCRHRATVLESSPRRSTDLLDQLATDLVDAAARQVEDAMRAVREGVERGSRPAAQRSRLNALDHALDVLRMAEQRRHIAAGMTRVPVGAAA